MHVAALLDLESIKKHRRIYCISVMCKSTSTCHAPATLFLPMDQLDTNVVRALFSLRIM